ncbi:hypothetical protein [Microbacterium sp. SORGH_AS_0862]|uniref:hypothetical protein n=1 Tax=Microbacterium sp. SORGH_AS_0862 TaxID=3041789 RepID=UPI002794920F|nr:hypothetical protein [Microbacterium sp. SORGH_AS_0862]MDQ1206600.1 1,4-dihydroxy-2-naphthoate octaprenyltransferase [Microbacterium sp. SORGH_AS_0862]
MSDTETDKTYPIAQWTNALMIGAGVTILLGFVVLFIPPMSLLAWLLLPLGFVCLLAGWVSHAIRLSTRALLDAIAERK